MKTYKIKKETDVVASNGTTVTEEQLKKWYTDEGIKSLLSTGYIEEIKELPKTWEELEEVYGYFARMNSTVSAKVIFPTNNDNRNIFPTKEEAEASIALAQLCQLRDRYNEGWKPDWTDDDARKYVVEFHREEACITDYFVINRVLAFKTKELAIEFLNNFSDLIEKAKPLL